MPQPTVLITGATGGLGRRAALALARRGLHVLVGGRRPDAVADVCAEVAAGGGRAAPFVADLSSLASVREAADPLPALDAVVTNAGITLASEQRSTDGFELTFAVNVLAHHLLLQSVADKLRSPARIVVVSSGVQIPEHKLARRAGVPAPRWVGARNLARPDRAPADQRVDVLPQRYSTSKLGNVMQARGFQAMLRARGLDVDVFAIDPGLMPDTELARAAPWPIKKLFWTVGPWLVPHVTGMRMSSTSAEHIASLVCDERWAGRGFLYLDGDDPHPISDDGANDDLVRGYWEEAQELVGLGPQALPEGPLPVGFGRFQAPLTRGSIAGRAVR